VRDVRSVRAAEHDDERIRPSIHGVIGERVLRDLRHHN
jgi:hypothetical protein